MQGFSHSGVSILQFRDAVALLSVAFHRIRISPLADALCTRPTNDLR